MHTLERELRLLHAEGAIDDATAARALARDRGQILSLHYELRGALYAGVLLIMAGVGIVLARNLDRIGPLAMVLTLAIVAGGCVVPAVRARLAGRAVTTAGEYLLFLSALLLSADVGYAERQFALLGPYWSSHLLILAVAHAVVAYACRSPLVLAVSLTAFAGWFGVATAPGDLLRVLDSTPELGARALLCAASIGVWRFIDHRRRPQTSFSPVFDHFAVNLAAWGMIAWCMEWPWAAAGLALLAVFACLAVRRGFDTGREAFLVYGVVYPAIGLCAAAEPWLYGTMVPLGFLLVVGAAATVLWQLRRELRQAQP